jgi:diguanylate cyclase
VQYSHDKDQATEYAQAAFARLRKEGLAPTPDHFELWYVYYAAQHPELSRAIDILTANKEKITGEHCRELFQRFLSEARDEDAIRRAGDQVNTTIKSVSTIVRDVKSTTATYNSKISNVSAQVRKIKDAGELKKILVSVMSDTQHMLAQNQKLETQLDKSSSAMEQLQRDLEKFRREALTDGLTGLANRKAFDTTIKRITDEAAEGGTGCTLLMLDIDFFKTFNDSYGHQVGDQVLRLVAKTLTDGVKGRDVACRYGGEEFAIILPDTTLQAGVAVGNSLRKSVATKDVINRATGEKLARITISAGVAEFVPGEKISELIERADAALYTAKHNGRNQVVAAPTPNKKQKIEDV